MTKEVDVENIRRKIEDAFHQEKVEDEFKELAGEDDDKHRWFKQILIHLICESPDIKLSSRKERNKLLEKIKNIWESQESVPSHDDVMKPDDLEEYDEDTHGTDDSPEPEKDRKNSQDTQVAKKSPEPGGQQDDNRKNLQDVQVANKSPEPEGQQDDHRENSQDIYQTDKSAENQNSHSEPNAPSGTQDEEDGSEQSHMNLEDDENNYKTEKGLALILWNTNFLDGKGGYDKDHSRVNIGDDDREMMGYLFKKYKFKVIGQEEFESRFSDAEKEKERKEKASGGNLLKEEVKAKIEEVKKVIKEMKPDIFVCVVSTHGLESTEVKKEMKSSNQVAHIVRHQLCFKDGLIDQAMFSDELIGAFDDNNCPDMEGKPRLFFIQACRTRITSDTEDKNAGLDEGVEVWYWEDKPEEQKKEIHSDKPEARGRMPKPKQDQNNQQAAQAGSQVTDISQSGVHEQSSSGNDTSSTMSAVQTAGEEVQDVQTGSQNAGLFGSHTPGESAAPLVATGPVIPGKTPEGPISSSPTEPNQYPVEVKPFEVTPSLCYPDCLVMFASPPGKTTFGREREGGWLILSLKKEFDNWAAAPERDLMEVLTRVNFEMVRRKTYTLKDKEGNEKEFKVVPCIQHALMKDIRLKATK